MPEEEVKVRDDSGSNEVKSIFRGEARKAKKDLVVQVEQ